MVGHVLGMVGPIALQLGLSRLLSSIMSVRTAPPSEPTLQADRADALPLVAE
jgi:hypothetical protein